MKTIKSIAATALTFIAASVLFVTPAKAQFELNFTSEKSDSLDFVNESSKYHPGGWNFDIIGLNIKTKKSSSSVFTSHIVLLSGWGFGFTNALNAPSGMDVNMGRSFNFCIEDVFAIRMHPWKTGTLSLGAGIDVRNYRMTGNQRFLEDITNKQISITDYPAGAIPDYSKIRTTTATFNLKYIQNLGRGFRLAFGPELSVIGHRNGQHKIVTRYEDATGEQKEKFKNIKTNKVGVNLVGVLNYKNLVGIYAKYSPSNVLNPAFGPEFQSLSVGMMFFGL